MWEENRKTTGTCQISFTVKSDNKTFPLQILKRINKINSELIKRGLRGVNVCSDKISFGEFYQKDRYQILPYQINKTLRQSIITPKYIDKGYVISMMCATIILWNENYIKDIYVNIDRSLESKELWQTAWSIYLSMEEDNK